MDYDLVFEGGGAKGMAFVGACGELLRRGNGSARLLGTSAGAITAALLAAGYTPEEMLAALVEKDDGRSVFADFLGEPAPFTDAELARSELRRVLAAIDLPLVPGWLERRVDDAVARVIARDARTRHVVALVERGGWFAADRFVSWLEARLDAGTWRGAPRAFSRMTLEQFHAATGVELSMVVSDTTDGALVVLNHRTAPRCPVVRAVRMSMSIPLVWDEVVWDATWGDYLGRSLAGHEMVDGGLLSNFPLELFVSDAPFVQEVMGPKGAAPVLGLLIDEQLPVPGAAPAEPTVRADLDPQRLLLVQRLRRLVDTATTAHDKMVLDEYAGLVVHLPAAGYGTTEFDMNDARRAALVDAGRAAMAAYLDRPAGPAFAPAAAAAHAAPSRADRLALKLLRRAEPRPR